MKSRSKMVILFLSLCLYSLTGNAAILLEEIVVTAQKREQNIQDVGIAITAFTGAQIRTLGYSNAQQVTALSPGVHTIQPNGEANYGLAIRGAANSDFTANQESPVSLYVDEVYISQMSGAGFMLFDMERVEILRGPQGTLFGRNATGGLAHFVTKKPEQEFGGYGQVTVGEYDQVKFEGAVTGGLSETMSARVSLSTHHNSGYVTNRLDPDDDLNNANDYAGRVQLLFEPNEDVSLLLNGRYSLQEIRTGFFENVDARVDEATGLVVKTPGEGNFTGYTDSDGDVFAGDYDRLGFNDLETYGVSGTLKWQLGPMMQFTSISDFQSVTRDYLEDSDASPFNDFNFYLTTDAEQFSQEVRLNGETDRSRWVAGIYYLDIEIDDSNGGEFAFLGGDPSGATGLDADGNVTGFDSPYQQDKKSWSVFGQVEYDLTEQLTLIGGFRWIDENVEFDYANNFVSYPNDGTVARGGNPNIIAVFGTYSGEYDEGLWSAKVALDYAYSDDLLLYASWNRGVKGGGFNALFDSTLEPLTDDNVGFGEEDVDAFEVGFKSTLFGGLATLNASVYHNDYKDFQAFDVIGLVTKVLSAPDAQNTGFEAELMASPNEGLDLVFGVGYVDNEITLPTGAKSNSVQTPRWNLNGLARYQWPAFNGQMAIQGDIHYRSRHFHALTRSDGVTENGYHVANARLSWTTGDEQWEVAVFANNVTDEKYIVQSFDSLTGFFGMVEEYYGRPRWVGGSVFYRF